jgi:SAM-dependent methyltransferase
MLRQCVARVDGVDRDPDLVAWARLGRRTDPGGQVILVDIEKLEEAPIKRHYDFVVCARSLHHVDLQMAVPAVARRVRPGGRLLIVDLFVDRPRGVSSYLLVHRAFWGFLRPRELRTWLRRWDMGTLFRYQVSICKLLRHAKARAHIAVDLGEGRPYPISKWREVVLQLENVTEYLLPGGMVAFVWNRPG